MRRCICAHGLTFPLLSESASASSSVVVDDKEPWMTIPLPLRPDARTVYLPC
jgi:hypothetical protein